MIFFDVLHASTLLMAYPQLHHHKPSKAVVRVLAFIKVSFAFGRLQSNTSIASLSHMSYYSENGGNWGIVEYQKALTCLKSCLDSDSLKRSAKSLLLRHGAYHDFKFVKRRNKACM